jgi:hypothetical protein
VVVLGLEFTPIQLGFGFTLNGVGGLFGQNRGVAVEALQAGLKTGALQAVLFPQNPVENAPRIISVLSSVFPVTPGQTIFGPALKIGWGTPTIIEAQLGLIVEFESPRRLILVGKDHHELPKSDRSCTWSSTCSGCSTRPRVSRASTPASTTRRSVPTPSPATSSGARPRAAGPSGSWRGRHQPHFEVPNGLLPQLERIRINLTNGNTPRAVLRATRRSPRTPSGGRSHRRSVSAAGFTLVGHLGIDALINTTNFTFVVDFSASVALRRGSTNIASLSLDGTITGPRPFHVDATASISFFLFSIDFHVSFSIGEDAPPALPTTSAARRPAGSGADRPAQTERSSAHAHADAWCRGARPPSARTRHHARKLWWSHPLGEVSVASGCSARDPLQAAGWADHRGDRRFTATKRQAGSQPESPPMAPQVTDLLSPMADYLELSDDQKLSRPAFETLKSGQAFTSDHLDGGDGEPSS